LTREHLNVARLAASQALMLSAIVMSMAVAGIIGSQLSPDPGLATLPIAAMVVGVAVASLPTGWLYNHFGWVLLNLSMVPLLVVALFAATHMARRARLFCIL
jgi:hypothetical protein